MEISARAIHFRTTGRSGILLRTSNLATDTLLCSHHSAVKDPIQLAENYIALSNAGNLSSIWNCFAADATYQSSQLGTFEGLSEIQAMMRGFYQKYAQPHWEVEHYRKLDYDTVEFSFQMTGRDSSGKDIHRRGVERIQFDLQTGKILDLRVSVL